MLYFFDTSALVKRYHLETGSPTVIRIFDATENRILIASLSVAELVSALNAVKNRRGISESDLEIMLGRFSRDTAGGRIGIVDMARGHITASRDLILKYGLSASDAIILALALELREFDPVFVCADVRSGLLHAAEACRLSTLNPLSP